MSELIETGLSRRVLQLQTELMIGNTAVLAQRCGAQMVNGRLQMQVWDTAVSIDPTNFVACDAETETVLDPLMQALLVYYLHTSDGTAPAQTWIAFTELPNGRFYTKAFQGYTGKKLAQLFGNDVMHFMKTAVACGGQPEFFGDVAFRFHALPLVPILVVGWQGDEDFSPSYKILFNAHIRHHLPTDSCAILGSMLTRRLLA